MTSRKSAARYVRQGRAIFVGPARLKFLDRDNRYQAAGRVAAFLDWRLDRELEAKRHHISWRGSRHVNSAYRDHGGAYPPGVARS